MAGNYLSRNPGERVRLPEALRILRTQLEKFDQNSRDPDGLVGPGGAAVFNKKGARRRPFRIGL
jgi:hypothetical protein